MSSGRTRGDVSDLNEQERLQQPRDRCAAGRGSGVPDVALTVHALSHQDTSISERVRSPPAPIPG